MNAKDTVSKGYDCFSKGDWKHFLMKLFMMIVYGLILVYQANIRYQECIMVNKL